MARSAYAWGIDIGKCALKAVRCRMAPDDPRKLIAEAFDYVEYPMMLTQPEADATELVRTALAEFVSRNDLTGDRVAVSVPGQAGLTKLSKLPPIEAKKIPDIVSYEARQQIPFPLEQVVWDWQRLAGGMEEGGFVLDAEVALFAMKREQVYKALQPLIDAGIDVELLQLTPVALYNMLLFDQLPADLNPDDPHPSTVLVSMGVDTTDIVVTDGFKLWQRSMPLGGSSFTKALVKDMKLTFAKAEHLKRNAVRAEDPKAVFKAMRPVFNEFTSELQRSLNFFTGANRSATIGKVLLLGNASKLRGLSDYVGKQLGLDVQRIDKFDHLDGAAVLQAPAFRENRLAFGTAYGLALQGAGGASMNTSLLPGEIVRDRIVESKKPWAVGALVGLLAAAMINFVGLFFAWRTYADTRYTDAFARADSVKRKSQAATAALTEIQGKRKDATERQQRLVQVFDRRFQTLDMLRAVESLLPSDPPGQQPENPADRNSINVDSLDCEYYPDLGTWFTSVEQKWKETHTVDDEDAEEAKPGADGAAAAVPAEAAAAPAAEPFQPPKGPGWVIQIVGHHYHNEPRHRPDEGEEFVRKTIVENLAGEGSPLTITVGPQAGQQVAVRDLGISFPVIVRSEPLRKEVIASPVAGGGQGGFPGAPVPGGPGVAAAGAEPLELTRHDFVLQFLWQPQEAPHEPIAAGGMRGGPGGF